MKKQSVLFLTAVVLISAAAIQPAHAFKFFGKKSKPVAPVTVEILKAPEAVKPAVVTPVVKPVVKAVVAPVAKPAVKTPVKPAVKPVAKAPVKK